MKGALLGLAAGAAVIAIAPADAQTIETSGFTASSAFANVRFGSPPVATIGRDFRRGHGRHIRVPDVAVAMPYGYAGGYYDPGDYDANRSFSPDKWNDWWHERPERAFPRWMSRNRDCARQWYAGDVLTC
jgi:hypothetical protein